MLFRSPLLLILICEDFGILLDYTLSKFFLLENFPKETTIHECKGNAIREILRLKNVIDELKPKNDS